MATRTKPIVIYYYKYGQLYKINSPKKEFISLEESLSFIDTQLAKGRLKNLQLVFVEYKEPYNSEIIHILKT